MPALAGFHQRNLPAPWDGTKKKKKRKKRESVIVGTSSSIANSRVRDFKSNLANRDHLGHSQRIASVRKFARVAAALSLCVVVDVRARAEHVDG